MQRGAAERTDAAQRPLNGMIAYAACDEELVPPLVGSVSRA